MVRTGRNIASQPGGGGRLLRPARGAAYMGTYQMPGGEVERRAFDLPDDAAAIDAYSEWCSCMDDRAREALSAARPRPKQALPDRRRDRKRLEHKKYYAETSFRYERRGWTSEEDAQVLAHSIPDRELSALIRRSMKSISNRRWRLLGGDSPRR